MSNMNFAQRIVSISTQHVGCGEGGTIPMVARVTLVDYRGNVLYDLYVQPTTMVIDYRTQATGITPDHLTPGALPFQQVQQIINGAVQQRIIVGHTLWHSLSIMGLSHPAYDTRDLALFLPYRKILRATAIPPLATIVWHLMRRRVRWIGDDSIENARACVDVYRSIQAEWERLVGEGQWPCALPPTSYARCYT